MCIAQRRKGYIIMLFFFHTQSRTTELDVILCHTYWGQLLWSRHWLSLWKLQPQAVCPGPPWWGDWALENSLREQNTHTPQTPSQNVFTDTNTISISHWDTTHRQIHGWQRMREMEIQTNRQTKHLSLRPSAADKINFFSCILARHLNPDLKSSKLELSFAHLSWPHWIRICKWKCTSLFSCSMLIVNAEYAGYQDYWISPNTPSKDR